MKFQRYHVREGQRDCSFYIQTGRCKYGALCLFNHPPDRSLATSWVKVEYPERKGKSECRYYMKGFCKFGATCNFNHTGVAERVTLNVLGYPLRPDIIVCAYYMRHGQCKFGLFCKYHHPEPSRDEHTGSTGYSPDYALLGMPRGAAAAPGWNTYNVSVVPSSGILPMASNGRTNGTHHTEAINFGGAHYRPGFLPPNCYVFPERPGQPECQHYMKTGECKYGIGCKYHHPKERRPPVPNCVLSPKGLPLRPGERLCHFYSRYGICKYGAICKYDHPMEASGSSSATEITAVVLSSLSENVALNSSQDGLVEEGLTNDILKVCLSEATQKPNGNNAIGSQCLSEEAQKPDGNKAIGSQYLSEEAHKPDGNNAIGSQCLSEEAHKPDGNNAIGSQCLSEEAQKPDGNNAIGSQCLSEEAQKPDGNNAIGSHCLSEATEKPDGNKAIGS